MSAKLLNWTNNRWIIAFSKEGGSPTLKEKKKILYNNLIKEETTSDFSQEVKKIFPDAEFLKLEDENNS